MATHEQSRSQGVIQHDIRTVFKGIYEVQQALSILFSEHQGSVFITNAKAAKNLDSEAYCLSIEGAHITLVEGTDTGQSKTRWDIETGHIYLNNHLQHASYIMNFIGKMKKILVEFKERKAGMYQHH